jgi:hypothetical protein
MKSNMKDCSAIEAVVKMSCRRYCSAPEADETADRAVRHRTERIGVPKCVERVGAVIRFR